MGIMNKTHVRCPCCCADVRQAAFGLAVRLAACRTPAVREAVAAAAAGSERRSPELFARLHDALN